MQEVINLRKSNIVLGTDVPSQISEAQWQYQTKGGGRMEPKFNSQGVRQTNFDVGI